MIHFLNGNCTHDAMNTIYTVMHSIYQTTMYIVQTLLLLFFHLINDWPDVIIMCVGNHHAILIPACLINIQRQNHKLSIDNKFGATKHLKSKK